MATARSDVNAPQMPAVVRGAALFLLEGLVIVYLVSLARGTWPLGHPWSGVGALLLAATLWSGATNGLGFGVGLGALALGGVAVIATLPF